MTGGPPEPLIEKDALDADAAGAAPGRNSI